MINVIEEYRYWQLKRVAKKLDLPVMQAFLEIEVMHQGKIIKRHHQRSHTWNRNAYNIFANQLLCRNANDGTWGAGYLNAKNTAGTLWAIYSLFYPQNRNLHTVDSDGYRGPAGDNDHGICVGSSTAAESFEHYNLQTLIAHGSGSGQLGYAQSESISRNYNSSSKLWRADWVRYFNNNSGGNVSVNEIGLKLQSTGYQEIMVSRDKLTSTVTIPNTGQLKVTYRITLTFPY